MAKSFLHWILPLVHRYSCRCKQQHREGYKYLEFVLCHLTEYLMVSEALHSLCKLVRILVALCPSRYAHPIASPTLSSPNWETWVLLIDKSRPCGRDLLAAYGSCLIALEPSDIGAVICGGSSPNWVRLEEILAKKSSYVLKYGKGWGEFASGFGFIGLLELLNTCISILRQWKKKTKNTICLLVDSHWHPSERRYSVLVEKATSTDAGSEYYCQLEYGAHNHEAGMSLLDSIHYY